RADAIGTPGADALSDQARPAIDETGVDLHQVSAVALLVARVGAVRDAAYPDDREVVSEHSPRLAQHAVGARLERRTAEAADLVGVAVPVDRRAIERRVGCDQAI